MTPRRLPLRPESFRLQPAYASGAGTRAARAGWARKTCAIALHMACLGLFGLTVVWPLASPLASGELAREFKPLLDALAAWAR